jgi:hypothetical protein
MSKIFISADIEGTTGINVWPETEPPNDYFRKQMTREVSAAANSAFLNGATDIVIKDAHDSARNLIPDELPRKIRLVRGWMSDPDCMMQGLDKSFDACIFTGYHSPAGNNGNPLSHTMTEPPPYSPFGITPSKLAYSRGWSSVRTASRRSPGRRLGPLGTDQLKSTPSCSRRKS